MTVIYVMVDVDIIKNAVQPRTGREALSFSVTPNPLKSYQFNQGKVKKNTNKNDGSLLSGNNKESNWCYKLCIYFGPIYF